MQVTTKEANGNSGRVCFYIAILIVSSPPPSLYSFLFLHTSALFSSCLLLPNSPPGLYLLNMEKTKQEIETQALLALEQNSRLGDTAYSTSAGHTVHSTTKKRNPTSTPASAKKKTTDPPLPASYVVKPRQGPSYDYAWYHSPLQEPAVYHMSDPAAAVTAYRDIKVVNKRVQFDLRNMKAVLLKEGLIEDSDSEDGDASSNCSIDFFDCAK